ncbi:MAG: TerB family tellurite resistance protein [Woeseiaceae bacterium]
MGIADLSNVINLFGGKEPDAEAKNALFNETILMTLARASSSDANIDPAEVETIQGILKREIGEEISTKDIRLAANSNIYRTAPLKKYLASARRKLDAEDRARIVKSLAEVLQSDCRISVLEVDFFNDVAESLELTPAELVGINPQSS